MALTSTETEKVVTGVLFEDECEVQYDNAVSVEFPIHIPTLYSTGAANNGLLSRFLTRFYFPAREGKVFLPQVRLA